MNKIQRDRFSMLLTVETFFDKHNATWAGLPPVVNLKTQLSNLILQVWSNQIVAQTNTKGYTLQKANVRNILLQHAVVYNNCVQAYSSIAGENELLKSIKLTPSQYKICKDEELLGKCNFLLQTLNDNATALVPYGISATTITSFENDINNFCDIIKTPLKMREARREANAIISLLLENAMQLVRAKLDPVMKALFYNDLKFVQEYTNTRKIDNSPTTKRSLTIKCIDAQTQKGIKDVDINIENTELKLKSQLKGINYISHIPEGNYVLHAKHLMYESVSVSFTITEIEKCFVTVVMNGVG